MTEKKKGGGIESAVLSTIDAYVERLISSMVEHVADMRPIRAMLDDLSPAMKSGIYNGLPGAVGLAVDRLPSSAFKTPERAEFVKDTIREVGKRIADAVGKGVKDPEEFEAMIDGAVKSVEGRTLLVDNHLGLVHLPDCAELSRAFLPKGKKHGEIPYKAAVDQDRKACPYCFPRIQEKMTAPQSSATQGSRKNLSPLDIVGMMDKKERNAFNRWLNSIPEAVRKDALESLQELDSIEEFHGLMSLKPSIRMDALVLLKERNAKHAVKGVLATIGTALKIGYMEIVRIANWTYGQISSTIQAAKRFDDSLAPAVQERRAQQCAIRDDRRKKVPFSLKNLLLPF